MTAAPEILGGMGDPEITTTSRIEDAWNRGDLDEMLADTPPDAEWVVAEENPDARTLRGPAEIRAYLEDWRDTVRGLYYRGTRYIDAGHAVVQIGTMTGRAGEDGPELTIPLAFVTRFRDGVPVRTEEYLDVEQALEAAGVHA